MTISFTVLLGLLVFALLKWGGAKASHIFVGVLFGIALAATQFGPPLLNGVQTAAASVGSAISNAVQ